MWGALSDERTGVCRLQLLLALASAVIFGPIPVRLVTLFYCLRFETSLFVAHIENTKFATVTIIVCVFSAARNVFAEPLPQNGLCLQSHRLATGLYATVLRNLFHILAHMYGYRSCWSDLQILRWVSLDARRIIIPSLLVSLTDLFYIICRICNKCTCSVSTGPWVSCVQWSNSYTLFLFT
jgi:hypothetical protein